jgi:hypothetical protein
MVKKDFFANWRGHLVDAKSKIQNQWKPAEGSSLNDHQRKILNEGVVIRRPKGDYYVKLFAKDEENQLYSVVVSVESELGNLIASMAEIGFVTAQ